MLDLENLDVNKIIDEIKEEIEKEKNFDLLKPEEKTAITEDDKSEYQSKYTLNEINNDYKDENLELKDEEQQNGKYADCSKINETDETAGYLENQEIIEEKKVKEKKRKISAVTIISNILFYAALITLISGIYFTTLGEGVARLPFGFSFANVLSSSMQTEIPKGSLVVIKEVEIDTLNVGDNITFLTEGNVTYTHKIVSVFENFNDTGMRAFETKGTENPMPDKEIVFEGNVIGKVVYHVKELGSLLAYLKDNIFIVIGLFVVLAVFSFLLSIIFSPESKKDNTKLKNKKEPPKTYKYE